MTIDWSPLALDKVIKISEYIAEDNAVAARQWVDGLFDAVQKLETCPLIGRKVPELTRKDAREIFYGAYRIIYKTHTERVEILTVRHGKQLLSDKDL